MSSSRAIRASRRLLGGVAAALLSLVMMPLAAQAQAPDQAPAKPARQRPPPLAVGAAIAADGVLWTVGLDAQRRLVLQRSADAGRTWTPAQVLDVAGDAVSADGENRPKIAFSPQPGVVVVTYTKPLPKPFTGDVRLLRSSDGGASFAAPVTVHADRSLITHRFESILFDEQGTLHTVWIDKRDQEAAKARGQAYRGAGVYRNESRDGGLSFGPDIRVADHSCECCRIALAAAPGGGVAALWRHVFNPNERDHAFAQWSASQVSPQPAVPVRATLDRWALDACPHHGPGLAAASDGGWHAVWFGIRQGQAAVRYGRLDASGQPSAHMPVRPLPDPQAEHADVAALGDRVVVVWKSFDGQRFVLRAWTSRDGGRQFELRDLATTTQLNDQPRLLTHGGRFWVVWRDVQQTRVETIDVP